MARALLSAGHRVHVYTSLPANRFPIVPTNTITSLVFPEIIHRTLDKLGATRAGQHYKMRQFGRDIARAIRDDNRRPDLFISWSSFGLETFEQQLADINVCVRDSTHIEHQSQVLARENADYGIEFVRDELCIERELREYDLADHILVLSEFARRTFLDRGIPARKLKVLDLGVDTTLFRPREKLTPHQPLNLVYFGTLSLRKGIQYLLEATQNFSPELAKLYLVGPVERDFRPILARYSHYEHFPALPHPELSKLVREMDAYVFPSLEDGFPNTLVQAMASGLIPITTEECGPAKFVIPDVNGYLIAQRDARAIRAKIEELANDPELVTELQLGIRDSFRPLGWERYATELQNWIFEITGHRPLTGRGEVEKRN